MFEIRGRSEELVITEAIETPRVGLLILRTMVSMGRTVSAPTDTYGVQFQAVRPKFVDDFAKASYLQ